MSVPAERPRDDLWDALVGVFGEPLERHRSLYGKIVSDLRKANATAGDVYARAQAWPLHFPGLTLTPAALHKYWSQLARQPLRADRREVEAYRERMLLEKWVSESQR